MRVAARGSCEDKKKRKQEEVKVDIEVESGKKEQQTSFFARLFSPQSARSLSLSAKQQPLFH